MDWTDDELGTFEYDIDEYWAQTVTIPSLAVFTYGAPETTIELIFLTESEDVPPSPAAASLGRKILREHEKLVSVILQALWSDICGDRPDSGMWWRGDIDQVLRVSKESFRDSVPRLESPEDLCAFLGPLSITIEESLFDYNQPVANVQFMSAFEDEHCVGVLTDGERAIGLGYAYPAPDPFENEQIK